MSHKDDVVVFIEFSNGKPFALVTVDDCRYDVEEHRGNLYVSCCGAGKCFPVCYLEGAKHQYWAAAGITVTTGAGDLASAENQVVLPVEYRGWFWQWPDVVERKPPCTED